MTTDETNGSPAPNHWQSIAEELGADVDLGRAAPVQPNPEIERRAAEQRAATAPRQPSEPAPFPTVDDLFGEPQPTTVRAEPATPDGDGDGDDDGDGERIDESLPDVPETVAQADDDVFAAWSASSTEPDDAAATDAPSPTPAAKATETKSSAERTPAIPTVAAQEERRVPPVEIPPAESSADEVKSSGHWSKLAGFLGIGGAKPAPSPTPSAAASDEGSAPAETEDTAIFDAFSSDTEIVQRKASQQFVDSMFGTDSSILPPEEDLEGSRFAETVDDTDVDTVRFQSQPHENLDDGDEPPEDAGERRPRRRRRRRGSRGQERGGEARETATDEAVSPADKTDEDPFESFHQSEETAADSDQAEDTGDDDSDDQRGKHRRIPSWQECIGTIVEANIENHNRGGGEGRPRRRRKRSSRSADN